MARIRRKVRGQILDDAGAELYADVAVLELDGGLLLVGRASDYPQHPELPRSKLRQVGEVAGAALRPSGSPDAERYQDLDGNGFVVVKVSGCAFGCGSPFRSIGSTVAV